MKMKNLFVGISVLIGIISMAAGVAVIVDRILKKKECYEGYIECGSEEEEIAE
ncbi:MAG: hypothetical protein IJP26_01290 [Clostridia bacterium]|nr:hypothetical protein [Clostridia bacterium]